MKRASRGLVYALLAVTWGCTEQNPTFALDAGGHAEGGPGDIGGPGLEGMQPGDGKVPADKGQPPPPSTSALVAVPAALTFSAVGVGCEGARSRSFRVINPTQAKITITKAALVGCGNEFTGSPFATGVLGPGASRIGSVTFKAAAAGSKACHIKFTASDGALIVPITAQAAPRTSQADSYTQQLNRLVDFIFVLDPSGSMTDEKPRLKATAPTFATAASSNKLDFHLGFISMVPGWGAGALPLGSLNGTPPYLTGSMKNLQSEFAKRIDMPTGGGNETGFDALVAAMSPPLSAVINPKSCAGCGHPHICHMGRCIGRNEGFRRETAASLEVLVFTDEDDGSKTSLNAIKSFLLWQVDPLKGQFVRVHALLPSAKCAYSGVKFTRWKGLIQSTGGMISDLCASDYKPAIKALTSRIFGLQDQFRLTRIPEQSSIKVTVNGKAVTGFKYSAASRSVTLNTAPADKAIIKISYKVSCS